MSEENNNNKISAIREWIVEHKLTTIGCLWLTSVGTSIAYSWSKPNIPTNIKVIHARLYAQALTLAALCGSAVVEYCDHNGGEKKERVPKFLTVEDRYPYNKD